MTCFITRSCLLQVVNPDWMIQFILVVKGTCMIDLASMYPNLLNFIGPHAQQYQWRDDFKPLQSLGQAPILINKSSQLSGGWYTKSNTSKTFCFGRNGNYGIEYFLWNIWKTALSNHKSYLFFWTKNLFYWFLSLSHIKGFLKQYKWAK